MRTFRGLENIHAVIDRHESEWRKDNGQEPAKSRPISLEEAVRRRLTSQPGEGSGKFAADRFLGGKTEPVESKQSPVPESEPVNLTKPPVTEPAPEPESTEPEAVEIIPNKDGKHSWLYNEVMKAINDAAKSNRNTKIIAVFIPVVQNGKEFENLPADETITISPINEDDTKIEPAQEPEAVFVEPEEAFVELEEIPAPEEGVTEEILAPNLDVTEEPPAPEIVATEEITTPEIDAAEEITVPEIDAVEETLAPENESSAEDFDLIPDSKAEQDTELAEAFKEMQNKLDSALEQDIDIPLEPEQDADIILDAPDDSDIEDNDDDILADGEPMEFEDIDTVGQDEDFALPDELDDDVVADDGGEFDETLTEIQLPDDDDDEIEIIPDPVS